MRDDLLAADDVGDIVAEYRHEVFNRTIDGFVPPQSLPEQWDIAGLEQELHKEFNVELPVQQWLDEDNNLLEDGLRERISEQLATIYQEKEELVGSENLRMFEKQIILRVLDEQWKDHLAAMDHLRQGIHLRGYAQKNPSRNTSASLLSCSETCWMPSSMTPSVTCPMCRCARKVRKRKKHGCASRLKSVPPVCSTPMTNTVKKVGSPKTRMPGRRPAVNRCAT